MKLLIMLLVIVSCNSEDSAPKITLAPTSGDFGVSETPSTTIGFYKINNPSDHPRIAFTGECFDGDPAYCDIEGVLWLDPQGIVEIHQMEFTARLELVGNQYIGQTSAAGCQALDVILNQDASQINVGGNAGTSMYVFLNGVQISDYVPHVPGISASCVTYGNY